MPVIKVSIGDFQLTSSWKCKKTEDGKYKFSLSPSTVKVDKTFNYSLPSGARVKTSRIYATLNSPYSGYSIRTANGNSFSGGYVNINLNGNSGALTVTFAFKPNGTKSDETRHYSTQSFTNVYLQIEYEGATVSAPATPATKPGEVFSVPPQSVCIVDQASNSVYMFDGVVKIQHAFSVKIDEEPDGKKKSEYVNNAINQPDKVTLDVVMSDVYADSNEMTSASSWEDGIQEQSFNKASNRLKASSDAFGTRSGNAVVVLHKMKEKRAKLSVITPQYVHVDMLISGITVNQDSDSPCGWVGQIEFQHAFKEKEKKKNNNSSSKSTKNTKSTTVLTNLLSFITSGALSGAGGGG